MRIGALLLLAGSVAAGAAAAESSWPRLELRAAGTENAWVAYGDRAALGYGLSPQNILETLPPGEARDPDFDFRDFAEWAGESGVTILRSYPPSVAVGPRYLDLFVRAVGDTGPFDLERFNPRYFERLREACALFREHGIFVHLQLWQAVTWKKGWDRCYYHPERNVNPELARDAGPGAFVIDPGRNAALLAHQREHVRRLLDATGDLGNVFYDVMNEIGNGTGMSEAWVEAILDEIEAWEEKSGLDVLVGLNDEGRDRDRAGRSLSNPRLEIAFLDLGRYDEHLAVRGRQRRPTFGVRNIDWDPQTRERFYFAGEYDLSINPDPGLHGRSRRMYWRMFLAKCQMNAGYADFGRQAYRSGNLDALMLADFRDILAGLPADGFARLLPAPECIVGAPGEFSYCLASTDLVVLLTECSPGHAGRDFSPDTLRLAGIALEGMGSALVGERVPCRVLDLGGARRSLAAAKLENGELKLPLPAFRDGLVVIAGLEADSSVSEAASGGRAAAGEETAAVPPRPPQIRIVRLHPVRAVLWAPGNLGENVIRYEWERRSLSAKAGDSAPWRTLRTTPTFLLGDEGLEPGMTYEYRVRAVGAGGHASENSAAMRITLPRRGLVDRARLQWRRHPEIFWAAAVCAGLAVGMLAGVLRHRRASD
jgi:hypothetical protein